MYSVRRWLYCLLVFCIALTFFSFTFKGTGKDKKKWVVVIDAGHGGKDPGCHGQKYKEKDVALAVTLKFGHYIEQNNKDVQVIYTRKTDVFVPLNERAAIANRNHADLFICIHCNANPNRDASGAATYVMGLSKSEGNLEISKRENSSILYEKDYKQTYNGFDPNSEEATVLFAMYQNIYLQQSLDLSSKIQNQYVSRIKRTDNGVKQAGFLVLWKTAMPSLLTEIGFLTNPEEEKSMGSQKGEDEIAKSIFLAFEQYKAEKDGTTFNAADYKMEPLVVPNATDTASTDTANVADDDTAKEVKKPVVEKHEKKVDQPVVKHDTADKKVHNMQEAVKELQHDTTKEVETVKATDPTYDKNDTSKIVYRVQFAVSPKPIPSGDKRIADVKDVDMYQDYNMYKYTAGHFYDIKDAIELQSEMHNHGYKDAFVVTFRGNKRITLNKLSSK